MKRARYARVPEGTTLYMDNKPVTLKGKGFALALISDANGELIYTTCYDLGQKPFVNINEEEEDMV